MTPTVVDRAIEIESRVDGALPRAPHHQRSVAWLRPSVEGEVIERINQGGGVVREASSCRQLKRQKAGSPFTKHEFRCCAMRPTRCSFPARRIDRHDRWNLARITNQHKPRRNLTEQHEIRPVHLPGLFHEHNVEGCTEFDESPLGCRANDDARARWQVLVVGDGLNTGGHCCGRATFCNEPNGWKRESRARQSSTDVVGLRACLRRDSHALFPLKGLLYGSQQEVCFSGTRRGLHDCESILVTNMPQQSVGSLDYPSFDLVASGYSPVFELRQVFADVTGKIRFEHLWHRMR